ncbi:MAG: sporulation transcriptional regulator SpoIIID [Oscillospiraceae bacterium]|nr:sporulation transcriptional regulator SpoIIID [Oscillospiraceae bacterium]
MFPSVSSALAQLPRSEAVQFLTTVHKDLTTRLPNLSASLYQQVRSLLDQNRAERHIRGGMATRRKYKGA